MRTVAPFVIYLASLLLLAASLAPTSLRAQSIDDLDRENGAFGHKFGELFTSFHGLPLVDQSPDGRVKVLGDAARKEEFLGVKVDHVDYTFFDGRLFDVAVFFPNEQEEQKALSSCPSRYGAWTQSNTWIGGLVLLTQGLYTGGPVIELTSIPLNHGYRKWKFRPATQ